MLNQLTIKNYALIQELSITPANQLNIITGETGAGKSIMLGAVGLLLGNRADTKALLNSESKCVIEGQFDISNYKLSSLFKKEDLDYEELTIIRREITPAGKSRAFVNDSPVTLDTLKKLGFKLMDVHSQHETLQLGKNSFQLKFVDVYAGTLALRNEYSQLFLAYKKARIELNALLEESKTAAEQADYNSFLLKELSEANLMEDEQEELESSVKMMEHAEEIKLKLNEALAILTNDEFSVTNNVQQLRQSLLQVAKYGESYEKLAERINGALIELNDISTEIEREEEKVNFDPEQAQLSQERLSLIYQLQQKHAVLNISELLKIQAELEEKVLHTSNLGDEIAKRQKEVGELLTMCTDKANKLSEKRMACFVKLAKELETLLAEVGMPDASIELKRSEIPLENSGSDEIKILFSANKGIAPQELAKVASGGEFSRLMFCLKYILAAKVSLPTIIFDEIDTGVSGEIAIKLASMMKKMAENHQVITISHLPQIAAKGDQHYFVYKDNNASKAISKIKSLSEDERIVEIAKMLGGDNPSEIAFENAKELIAS